MNIFSKIKQGISNRIGNRTEESESMVGKHNNHYQFTELDYQKSAEARRLKAEIKRQKAIREAYLEKLQDDLAMKELQSQMNELDDDKENMEDFLMKQAMEKILGAATPQAAPSNDTSFNSFEQEVMTKTNEGLEPQPEAVPEEELPQSRFTDEQLKQNIPKLLNTKQIDMIKGLREEEYLQIYDIIQKGL